MATTKANFLHINLRTITLALAVACLCVIGSAKASHAASPASDSIKDYNLKNCIIQSYNNTNGTRLSKLTVKQLSSLTNLSCKSLSIKDVTGLERLTNLQSLTLSGNRISTINLAKNSKLTKLDLRFNRLKKLDLSKQTKLQTLYLNGNNISSLNIKKNKALTTLKADNILLETNATASQAGAIYVLDLTSLKFFKMPTHLYYNDTYDYNNDYKLLATKDRNAINRMMTTGVGFNYSQSAYRIKLPTAKNVSMNTVAVQLAKIYQTHAKTYAQLVTYLNQYGITEPQTRSAAKQAGIAYDKKAMYSDLAKLMGYFAGQNTK